MKKINLLIPSVLPATLFATSHSALAIGQVWEFEVSGQTWGGPGTPGNTVLSIDLSAHYSGSVRLNGVGWDYQVSTVGASWVSENRFLFSDDYGDTDYLFIGSSGQPSPGVGQNASDGVLKLADYNVPDIMVQDGIINIEFFDTFDDGGPGQQDSNFRGTIYIQILVIPAPGALVLLGCSGLVARRRRRD